VIVNALKVAGGDLWQRTRELEVDLRREETEAVEDYVRECAGVAQLRLQIDNCDAVLGVFEELVNKCQTDLGSIAGGIRHMKERADAFEVLSKNRQGAEASVAKWVEGISIPRGLSRAIHEVDVGDVEYFQHLQTLGDKLAFYAKQSKGRGDTPVSCRNAGALLHRLQMAAVERISAHLKREMRQLEDDNKLLYALTLGQAGKADAHQLLNQGVYALTLGQAGTVGAMSLLKERQQALLRSSPLIHFLIAAPGTSKVYQEVLERYTDTMRRALASQIRAEYKSYACMEIIGNRHLLFPAKESSSLWSKGAAVGKRGLRKSLAGLTGITKGVVGAAKGDIAELRQFNPATWAVERPPAEEDWCLGDRLQTILAMASTRDQGGKGGGGGGGEEGEQQPPECILQRLLLSFGDLLDHESAYLCRLFPQRASDELPRMFVHALSAIREAAEVLIYYSYDPISLLLMVLSLELSQRKVCDVLCCDPGTGEGFDDFYMWGYMTIWPCFKETVDAQVESVCSACATVPVGTAGPDIRRFVHRQLFFLGTYWEIIVSLVRR